MPASSAGVWELTDGRSTDRYLSVTRSRNKTGTYDAAGNWPSLQSPLDRSSSTHCCVDVVANLESRQDGSEEGNETFGSNGYFYYQEEDDHS